MNRYNNVPDMLRGIGVNEDEVQKFEKGLEEKTLGTKLFILRTVLGLRLSKKMEQVESLPNSKLTTKVIEGYLEQITKKIKQISF